MPVQQAVSCRFMSRFSGGSPWAMARDIGAGFVLVTDRTLARMTRAEVDKLSFELERCLRDLRGAPTAELESTELQRRNRTLLKLTSAQRVLRAHLMKRKGL
jgi:hypothetical protein